MYQLSRLANGLSVLSVPLKGRRSVGLAIWAKVGARFESKRLSGISHCLEHMLFKGTKHRSTRRIKEDVEGVGGIMNAFTGEESTCYYIKIMRDHAESAFDVLADMARYATLDRHEFAKERTVILEEIKMYMDLPSQHVHELLNELMWPDQPLGRPIAGNVKTVSQMNVGELRAHMKRYYRPSNLLVSFSGDIPHAEAMRLAEKAFQNNSAKHALTFTKSKSWQNTARFRLVNKKTEQMHVAIGFHALAKRHPDRYPLSILNTILGANMSSRLFEEVREKRGLAYEIRSGIGLYEDAGVLGISVGVEPKKAKLAIRVVMRELKRLKKKLVSPGELKRAKEYYIGQFNLGLEDTLDHMLWVGERCLFNDELPNHRLIMQQIQSVTVDDVQRLANKIFRTRNLNLSLIGPYQSGFERAMESECDCD